MPRTHRSLNDGPSQHCTDNREYFQLLAGNGKTGIVVRNLIAGNWKFGINPFVAI